MITRLSFLLLFLSLPICGRTQITGEQLLQSVPPGYKIALQARQGNTVTTQMVPVAEEIKGWSETIAVSVFLGEKTASVTQFLEFSKSRWQSGCPKDKGVTSASLDSMGTDHGYPFAIWHMSCKPSEQSDLPEYAWFKAIKGNDSFYVISKSFKFAPSKEQVLLWVGYLEKLAVCDTRLQDRACPSLDHVGK